MPVKDAPQMTVSVRMTGRMKQGIKPIVLMILYKQLNDLAHFWQLAVTPHNLRKK